MHGRLRFGEGILLLCPLALNESVLSLSPIWTPVRYDERPPLAESRRKWASLKPAGLRIC